MKWIFLMGFLAVLTSGCGTATASGEQGVSSSGSEGNEEVIGTTKNAAISAGSSSGQKAVVAVDAGFAGNNTTIATPSGFTIDECKFTAAVAMVQGSAISTSVTVDSTTGDVTCEKVVQERSNVPAETQDCVASYTMICVHEVAQ